MNLTSSQLTTVALGLAVCGAIYKFVPNAAVKAAALGIGGVIVAKQFQLPFLAPALA